MLLTRQFTHCLIRPDDVPPSQSDVTVVGVFNPGVADLGREVVLLARVAEGPAEKRAGWIALPRWDIGVDRIVFDWVREEEVVREDNRSVRFKDSGIIRLTFASHLCIARSADGKRIDSLDPARFRPAGALEEYGIEDPRITRIADTFYITYVAISRHGPATTLVSTRDFLAFERHGVVFCPDNKDVVLFPEKIGGNYCAIHRPSLSGALTRPEMWLASSNDLKYWGAHEPLWGGSEAWETGRVGAGAPPIRTRAGWLELYHGNDRRHGENRVGAYTGSLLLLDANELTKVRGKSGVIFAPELDFERQGFVPDVVFPTGIVERGDLALVYYGAADTVTAVTAFRRDDLLAAVGA
ncbi:MAG: putative glycosylase [Lacunisphaera sp.]|nr:putative glycosylase [Lacunisphaera sp.]